MAPSSPRSTGRHKRPPEPYDTSLCSADDSASLNTQVTHVPPRAPPPEPLLSRLEAVGRDRFALYGRQHAHVDHISAAEQDNAIVLQSTLQLQEDGTLSSRLDDVTYLLDGLLTPAQTPRARLAQARSVLELAQLLQDPQILQAVELSSQRRSILGRIQLLLSGLPSTEETHQVSLSVLVFLLSGSAETQEVFTSKVLDAIVETLKRGMVQGQKKGKVVGKQESGSVPLKKCLRRKQNSDDKSVTETEEAVNLAASTMQLLEECCWTLMEELLQAHQVLYLEGELQISVADVLCAALHKLLQVDCSASPGSTDVNLAQLGQRAGSGDVAGDRFALIRGRKRHLVRDGGVDVLAHALSKQIRVLEAVLPSPVDDPVTLDCARCLHSVKMTLSVFEQVTFLTPEVQRYISRERTLFTLLLKLVQLLNELSWGTAALKRWKAESIRMSLGVEVMLAALRVLLNLTHHNGEAAGHLQALGGMELLVQSFSWLQDTVSTQATTEQRLHRLTGQHTWEFDASLLLLSVMVNSIEFSDENRDSLVRTTLLSKRGDAATPAGGRVAACDLLIRFFQAKLQSYEHLIDMTEDGASRGTLAIEEEGDDWNPEDIILGGCTSLLLGYLMKGSRPNTAAILKALPDGSPRLLLRALGVFVAFHSQVGVLTSDVASSVLEIEEVLKSCQGRDLERGQRNLLTDGAVNPLPIAGSTPTDSIPSAKAMRMDVDQPFTVLTGRDSNEKVVVAVPPPPRRARPLKNLCSNIDDSDDDEPRVGSQGARLPSKESERPSSESVQVAGMRTPTRVPPRSPGLKQFRGKSPMESPPSSRTTTKSPMRGSSRSSLTAVLPDGRLSSPVVARLLKRTRELVDEFDAEFAKPTRLGSGKESASSTSDSSPCMVLTMDVTCRDNGNDSLELSQDTEEEKVDVKSAALSSKRRKKPVRDPIASVKSSIAYQDTPFDVITTSTPPATPLRKAEPNVLLQTPTRKNRSPGLCLESPSFNMTPTKTPPALPLRKKSASLLQIPTRNAPSPITKNSASPHRRKSKAPRVASARSSTIFDFTE